MIRIRLSYGSSHGLELQFKVMLSLELGVELRIGMG